MVKAPFAGRTIPDVDSHAERRLSRSPIDLRMTDATPSLHSLDDLRAYVHATLCEKENLLPEQSRLVEYQLEQAGRNCGLQFYVHGPRLVRLGAIWVADQNLLYFYDARGERYGKLKLEKRIAA